MNPLLIDLMGSSFRRIGLLGMKLFAGSGPSLLQYPSILPLVTGIGALPSLPHTKGLLVRFSPLSLSTLPFMLPHLHLWPEVNINYTQVFKSPRGSPSGM